MGSEECVEEAHIRILQAIWSMAAIGSNRITLGKLSERLRSTSAYVEDRYDRYIEELADKMIIEKIALGREALVSLSPFGLALVRELKERALEALRLDEGG